MILLGFIMSLVYMQAVHGWLSAYERLVNSQNFFSPYLTQEDFSRLGRNFVETGQYLEQVFPLFGVRFIAINDNYDSLNRQSRDGMLVPIKSMINEMYSKDLSQKIQSCFRSKEARGEIYTPVPFGYKKDQKNHLVLDEEVSDVVVRIFLWKKSGMKEREIAKKLSAQGIPTPFTRRCQLGYLKNTLRVKDPTWQTVFVTKVLENPIYTGTMVYNRIAYDETNRKIGQNPRESWRMVPDSHPAIISWELFDEISALREAEQAVKEERKKWCRQRRKNNPNIFKGRIFCKKCGEKLVCHWQSDGTLYFYCAYSMNLECRLYRHKWVQGITARDVMEFGQVVENPMIGAIPSRNEVQRELDDLLMSM